MTVIYRTGNGWLVSDRIESSFIYLDRLPSCQTFHSDKGLVARS